jgi:hypothetical protein
MVISHIGKCFRAIPDMIDYRVFSVMPGLVPGIHVLATGTAAKTWMAGTSPAMTE